MSKENFEENWDDPKSFIFGNRTFGGYYNPRHLNFRWPMDITPEELEKIFEKRAEHIYRRGKEFKDTHFPYYEEEPRTKKERLQPLSIRVKPHTKKFLKEESTLTAREIIEIYEDYNNGTESYINSLIEDEEKLQQEIEEIQEKLQNAKLFREKLEEIEDKED